MAVAPPLPAGGSGLPPAPYPPSSDAAAARSSDPLHSAEDGSPNVAGGTEQPSSSANNMLRMFGSQPANAAEAPTDATDALSKLAGLKTGSLWGKMKMAVGAAAKVKRASDLEVPDYDAALRKGTFRASFGTAERNIGDYIQTEAPAVHSYIEPTSTLKTNGIAWSKPHQPRARPQPSARKQGVAELLGIDPLASARPVLPEKGLSNSAPASLRASPLQTHSRPSPAAGLLPSLVHPSGCGSLPNTPPRRRAVVGMGWEAGRDADSEAAGKSASGYVRRSGVGWQAPSPPAGSGGGPSSSSRPRLGSGGELEQNVVMADTGPSAPPAPKLRGSNRERRTSHEMPPIDDAKQQARQRMIGKLTPTPRIAAAPKAPTKPAADVLAMQEGSKLRGSPYALPTHNPARMRRPSREADTAETGESLHSSGSEGGSFNNKKPRAAFEILVSGDDTQAFYTEIKTSRLGGSLRDLLLVPFLGQVKGYPKGTRIACSFVEVNGRALESEDDLRRPLHDFHTAGQTTRLLVTIERAAEDNKDASGSAVASGTASGGRRGGVASATGSAASSKAGSATSSDAAAETGSGLEMPIS